MIYGSDYSVPVTFTYDSDWTPYDLTWCTVYFTVKYTDKIDLADSTALIKKTITSHTDPTLWKTTITLTDDETKIDIWTKAYDLAIKTAGWLIHHANSGTLLVKDSVTKDFSA